MRASGFEGAVREMQENSTSEPIDWRWFESEGPVAMIVSDDLGATWQQIELGEHASMAFDVHFFNRNEGFIAASTNTDVRSVSRTLILRNENGGKQWSKSLSRRVL